MTVGRHYALYKQKSPPFIPLLALVSSTTEESSCSPPTSQDSPPVEPRTILRRLAAIRQPSDLLLLITPANCGRRRRPRCHKLHILDRSAQLLHWWHIGSGTLARLRRSRTFQRHNCIIASVQIDLAAERKKSGFLGRLIDQLSTRPLCRSRSSQTTQPLVQKCRHWLRSRAPPPPVGLKPLHATEIFMLLARINAAADEPEACDIERFFLLAEWYELRLFVRPELLDKLTPAPSPSLSSLGGKPWGVTPEMRYAVDAFLRRDCYVGAIVLDAIQLQRCLAKRPRLLSRLCVIDDVSALVPLPAWAWRCLRALCNWLGIEILYDAFGEFLFELYKHFIQL